MRKIILLTCILIMSIGCKKKAESISSKGVGNFEVEFLFENEGCKMYRFLDGGRYVYYSDCSGKIQYTYTTGSKNKNTHYVETLNN